MRHIKLPRDRPLALPRLRRLITRTRYYEYEYSRSDRTSTVRELTQLGAMRNLLLACGAALLATAAHAFSSDDSYGATSYGVGNCGKENLHTYIGAAGGTFECCSEWGADQARTYDAERTCPCPHDLPSRVCFSLTFGGQSA